MSAPTVWALLVALAVGCLRPGPVWLAPAATVVLAGAAAVTRSDRRRAIVAVAAMALLGVGLSGGRIALTEQGLLAQLARRGGASEMRAVAITDARDTQFGAWLLLRVVELDGRRARERALLRVERSADAPALGTTVAFRASARPLEHDGFDGFLRRRHTAVVLRTLTPLRTVAGASRPLAATNRVRQRVRAAARRHLPPAHAALLSGLVTGDTTGLPQEAEKQLTDAGLSHLVAVSGANVALVLGGVVAAASLAGVGARGRRWLAAGALAWFVLLVRAEPSVLRAGVMAVLVLVAQGTGRGAQGRHVLAVAGLLLLLGDPLLAGQLGFALSLLATAGVLLIGPAVARRLPLPPRLSTVVGASIGAQAGVAPVLLTVQGAVPLASLPANLLAVPAAAVASALGVAAALLAQVWQPAAAAVAVAARPALAMILASGEWFADGPRLHTGQLRHPAAVALAVAGLAGWCAARTRSGRAQFQSRRRAVLVAVLALLPVLTLLSGMGGPVRPVTGLTLTALDVGQGDALLVEAPGKAGGAPARMLVDGGPDPDEALRLLRGRGVNRLDVVAVSHPHADHSNGLPAVIASMPVGAVVMGPEPPDSLTDPAASALAVVAAARGRRVPVVAVAAGQRFPLGTAEVAVLGPPGDGSLGDEPNDNSLVLHVSGPGGSLLLAGDAEEAAQRRLLRRPDLLRADILKVPHHGGATNAEGFLDAVAASVAIVSAGAGNDYGHPRPEVLADLGGARILRTDTDGEVGVTLGPAGVETHR